MGKREILTGGNERDGDMFISGRVSKQILPTRTETCLRRKILFWIEPGDCCSGLPIEIGINEHKNATKPQNIVTANMKRRNMNKCSEYDILLAAHDSRSAC